MLRGKERGGGMRMGATERGGELRGEINPRREQDVRSLKEEVGTERGDGL